MLDLLAVGTLDNVGTLVGVAASKVVDALVSDTARLAGGNAFSLNASLRPLAKILTFPLIIVTLGIFALVINGLMLWLTRSATKPSMPGKEVRWPRPPQACTSRLRFWPV
jgi:uncharacterized membrane protein YvlD (DUF360 family)